MIEEGLERAHFLPTGQLVQVRTVLASAAADMRSTTEEFVTRQNAQNDQFNARSRDLSAEMEG